MKSLFVCLVVLVSACQFNITPQVDYEPETVNEDEPVAAAPVVEVDLPVPEIFEGELDLGNIADVLIDEYEVRYGEISDRCDEHVHNIQLIGQNDRFMGIPDKYKGVHIYTMEDGGYVSFVYIRDDATGAEYNVRLVHEAIHALLACLSDPEALGMDDGDGDHNQPEIWCTKGHGCQFDGQDDDSSLEYAVSDMVRCWDGGSDA